MNLVNNILGCFVASGYSYSEDSQEIKDSYSDFEVPYNGKDNDDYVNGQGFCCDDNAGLRAGNDNLELYQYYYHSDHLGSTSLITDLDGNVVQHVEYVPFGEVFIEDRNNKWNTPYLFNAKELDEETGLYYYGARYYDSRISLWQGADPMQEKYTGVSTYAYCVQNPVKFVDPNGMDWIENEKTGEVSWYKGINESNTPKGYTYIGEEYKGIKINHLGSASDPNQDYYGVSITLTYTNKDKKMEIKEFNWIQSYTATGSSTDTGKPVNDIGDSQPEKDNAPYYYSQMEQKRKQTNNNDGSTSIEFYDRPLRSGNGSCQWKAELSLVDTDAPQKPIITLQYGFKGGNKKLEIFPVKVIQPS